MFVNILNIPNINVIKIIHEIFSICQKGKLSAPRQSGWSTVSVVKTEKEESKTVDKNEAGINFKIISTLIFLLIFQTLEESIQSKYMSICFLICHKVHHLQ